VNLCRKYGLEPPAAGRNHYYADFGPFKLRWERHTEFARYQFAYAIDPAFPFDAPPGALPEDWIGDLPGDLIVSTQLGLIRGDGQAPSPDELSARYFSGNNLVGSSVLSGAGQTYTDFRIRHDGFSRALVVDQRMTTWQSGRIVQRLLEIDTYRMMALLALPVARALGPFLSARDRELAEVTAEMARGGGEDADPVLLDRLMQLEADIEGRFADNHYRFSASAAYYALVKSRIEELDEQRIPGLQTFSEFTERRLAPAMNTCVSVERRVGVLSERVARSTQLLATRVGVTRERQNQQVLETMSRRAKLQLRLQQTVEGLSVAAISYYIVGILSYAFKALKSAGVKVDPDLLVGISIPVVIFAVAIGIEGVRKRLESGHD
jgi:uncharacterized membrane-anchored protein